MSREELPETRRNRLSLGTLLIIVAVIAAECAVVVEIRRCYASIPSTSSPAFPEWLASPAVLLWIILASLAVFAIRKCSLNRLAVQLTISCALVTSRLSVRGGALDGAYTVIWPAACFGLFFVTPYLLVRFSRVKDSALVVADAAVVALLAYEFAVRPYVPLV